MSETCESHKWKCQIKTEHLINSFLQANPVCNDECLTAFDWLILALLWTWSDL